MASLTRLVTVAGLALVTILSLSSPAAAQTAPSSETNHAACYRSILEADDLYCLTRFELPDSISDGVSDAWCAELVNQDGCDGTPADPVEPTSLPQNTVFITLYDNCAADDCSAGNLLNVSRVPRIGFGVGGSYMVPGHGVTWADGDVALCLESSDDPAVFGTSSIDCLPVFWNSGENTVSVQRALLGADMVDQVRAVGIEQAKPTSEYVQNNLINSNGKVFALEALSNADRILDVFSSGAAAVVIPGNTPAAGSTVQAQINSSTSAVQTAKTNFGASLGISGDATGVIVSMILVFLMFLFAYGFSRNLMISLVISVSFSSVFVIFGFLPFQVLAVFIAILALPAAVKIVKVVTSD